MHSDSAVTRSEATDPTRRSDLRQHHKAEEEYEVEQAADDERDQRLDRENSSPNIPFIAFLPVENP